MQGHSDSLILVAPVRWWPALSDLSRHPLHPSRSFCAAVTSTAAPHPHHSCASTVTGTQAAHATPTYDLSRLGHSVFLSAQWVDAGSSAESRVLVQNPFSGEPLLLEVAQYPAVDGATVPALARAHRIFLQPRPVAPPAATEVSAKTPTRSDEDECLDLLLQRHRRALIDGALQSVRRMHRTEAHPTAAGASRVHATLVTGEPGSGKRTLVSRVCAALPDTLTLPSLPAALEKGVLYALEYRCLNFRDLLTLDEQEAVQVVRATLQPIPHETTGGCTRVGCAGWAVRALVVVRLLYVDLLWDKARGNTLTDLVAYQLCSSIDEAAAGGPTTFLLWSTAAQPSVLSPALRQRLAGQHVHLAPPTAGERAACLALKLQGGPALSPQRMEALVEGTAHLTAVRLACLDAGALARTEAAKDTTPDRSLMPWMPQSRGDSSGARHPAYAHLFNVDGPLAALEELVVWPLAHLRLLQSFRVPCSKGVLLCGPSGSGKTALLSALAGRLKGGADVRGVHVMVVDGLSLMEKEVGRSEKNIARLFEVARAHAPTALFLDNLDALAPPRGRESSEVSTATDRTLSTLLTEMDGVGGDPDRVVVVVASAPRAADLDPAVRRPGRLDVHLTLEHPTMESRSRAIRERLVRVLEHLLSLYGLTDPHGDRLRELEAEALAPLLPVMAAGPSSAAETVAVVREVVLSTLTDLAADVDGEKSPEWVTFKSQLVNALTRACRSATSA